MPVVGSKLEHKPERQAGQQPPFRRSWPAILGTDGAALNLTDAQKAAGKAER